MSIAIRRHRREVIIAKRASQATWFDKEPGRLAKISPFDCGKPKCGMCYYKEFYAREMTKLKERSERRELLEEYGSVLKW